MPIDDELENQHGMLASGWEPFGVSDGSILYRRGVVSDVSRAGRRWQAAHGWLTIGWLTQFPLAFWLLPSLQVSVAYLVAISIAAAALGEVSAWQAARVEAKVDQA